MTERDERYRDARDLGGRSPASEEAKQQNPSGQRGGPRSEGQRAGSARQPAQGSGRRGARKQEPARERKGYGAGEAPSEQGDQDHPSPRSIADGQRGVRGRRPTDG